MEFEDFNLDLYEDSLYSDGDVTTYSWNSSTSIICATLTNVTEDCQFCY